MIAALAHAAAWLGDRLLGRVDERLCRLSNQLSGEDDDE